MTGRMIAATLVVLGALLSGGSPAAQRGGGQPVPAGRLTPQDYVDIQQLVAKYAYAIDECTNRGYDYADLYTPDGTFSASRSGKVLARYEGRDRLAEAARGSMPDCKDVPWAGIVHMLVNHVIEPARGGATGKVYLIAVNVDGVPGKTEAQGRYEDVYVKTTQGWRFRSRLHVLTPGQAAVSRGSRGQ